MYHEIVAWFGCVVFCSGGAEIVSEWLCGAVRSDKKWFVMV